MNSQKILRYDYFILAFIIVLIYFKTLDYGFVNLDDDIKILNNYEKLSDPGNLLKAFTTDSYFMEGGYYYRPTLTLSFFLNAAIGGNNPFVYHQTNLILHIITSLLILLCLKKCNFDPSLAFLLTLVYAINPLLINAVVWIPGRNDIMAGLFIIASMIYFARNYKSRKINDLILHLLFFILSVFSKETALLFPAIIILYIILIKRENYFKLKNQYYTFAWAITLAFYLFMRRGAVKNLETDTDILSNIIYNLALLPELIGKFALPLNLSGLPVYSALPTIIGSMMLALMVLILILNLKRNSFNNLLFGFLWILIFSIPGMFTNPGQGRFDYLECRAYIPLMGFVFFFITFANDLVTSKLAFGNKMNKIMIYSFTAFLAVIYSFVNINLSSAYSNPLKFYNIVIENNPNSALALNNRGLVYKASNQIQQSINDFNKAIEINPEFADAYFNLGSIYDLIGRKSEAIALFNRGLEHRPEAYNVYLMRGRIKESIGDIAGAIDDFTQTVRFDSTNFRAYFSRGMAYQELKEFHKAIDEYTAAISIEPNYIKSYINRGIAYTTLKEFNKGIKDYNSALALDSTNADIFLYRANCEFLMGDTSAACLDWYSAASIGSSDASRFITRYCR